MNDIEALVAAEAQRQGVPAQLAVNVARAESRGRQSAVSPKGAGGVMQLMPATARGMGVDPTTLSGNIQGGVSYLKQQLDHFGGDQAKALAAYNAGPGAVARYGGVPPYKETRAYVDKVMAKTSDPAADAIFGDGPGVSASTGNGGSDPAAEAIFSDPSTGPQPMPAAPHAAPVATHPDQGLGFLKGAFTPTDHASNWLLPVLRDSAAGPTLAKAGAALGNALPPGVTDFIRNPQGFFDAQAAQGKRPGKIGEFAGNVASTLMMPGGPMAQGAETGALLSDKKDPMGVLGDAAWGAVGGKVASKALTGVGSMLSGSGDKAVRYLADRGVPMTVGQIMGGPVQHLENAATSVPVLGDVIRNAQRRGLQGANRAAFDETLGAVGEKLPKAIDIGRDAFNYTKGRLGELYDSTLSALGTLHPDQQLTTDLGAVSHKLAQIGDAGIQANVQKILQSEVASRFQGGAITGDGLKSAQEALGKHIQDLSKGTKWSRDAADALGDVKASLEGLAARSNPAAGEMLANVNKAWSMLMPIQKASASTAAKDGIFTLGGLNQAVAGSRSKATVAAGKAPLQDLSNAAAKVLPSTVPDSGTAGRLMLPAIAGGLMGGHLPVIGPAAIPATGLIGGAAALYTRTGQKALTAMAASHNPAIQNLGLQLKRLAMPAGAAGAVAVTGARQ